MLNVHIFPEKKPAEDNTYCVSLYEGVVIFSSADS